MNCSLTDYLRAYNAIRQKSVAFEYDNPAEQVQSPPEFLNVKIAVLRSYSCDILEKIITVDFSEKNIKADVMLGGFGQFSQEILDENSALYDFSPDIVLFAVNIEDLAPWLLKKAVNLESVRQSDIKTIPEELQHLIAQLTARIKCKVFVMNFVRPYYSPESAYEAQNLWGMPQIVRFLNNELTKIANDSLYILDFEGIMQKIGAAGYDLKMRLIAKNPYTFQVYKAVSAMLLRAWLAAVGWRKKCIALDLDNTLWKGIIGEDGFGGIEINDAFKEMQKQLLYLNNSGILLAIVSKNNEMDALTVLDTHPDMILKRDNFSAVRINWSDKASNLRRIAHELNIGLDSIIFIDDSPFECGYIRESLPEVTVVELDGNYVNYPNVIKQLDTDFIYLTDEDKNRQALYLSQKSREILKSSSKSLDDYLKGLQINVSIKEADDFSIKRAAQLTQKTNQFNLTSRRYTAEQLTYMASHGYRIYTVNDSDRFGDNGQTGVMIIKTEPAIWEIDTFLLSCRVMNRGIEKAFMYKIINLAREHGVNELIGRYIQSERNNPVRHLYRDFGFIEKENEKENEKGVFWNFNVNRTFECPSYISITE